VKRLGSLSILILGRYILDELKSVGFTNYIQKQNVLAIEWGEKFFEELEGFLKKKKVKIYKVNFEYVGENERFVTIFR